MSQAYNHLMNVLAAQKKANDALLPAQPLVPSNLATPSSEDAAQQMLVEQRYAQTAAMELGAGTAANPLVQPTAPETINLQGFQEVQQKAAAEAMVIEKAAREYAHEVFGGLVDEHNQKVAAAAFQSLSPVEQQVYIAEAQKQASLEAAGYIPVQFEDGVRYVHPSAFQA